MAEIANPVGAPAFAFTGHELGDILHTSRVSVKETMAKLVEQGWVQYEGGREGRYDLLVDLDDVPIPAVVEAVEDRIVAFAASNKPPTDAGTSGVTEQ